MLGKAENGFSPNLNFLHFSIIKILQFKVTNFPLAPVLPFLPVLQEKINFSKVDSNLLEKQLIYSSDSLLCFGNNTDKNTFESYKHAATF